jgi:hypothetical protein
MASDSCSSFHNLDLLFRLDSVWAPVYQESDIRPRIGDLDFA